MIKSILFYILGIIKIKINANNRSFCFEIFGYDFMMDIDFNVYLLEINTNPGLEISSPWIKAIVPRMVDDALRLTMDEVFPPKYQFDKNSITELNYEEYSNDLIHPKEEIKNEGPRKIKRKRFTTICDQGSGTQDVNDEQYQQENIRQREVKIQKKININNEENIKTNENNNKQPENEKDSIKEQKEKNNEIKDLKLQSQSNNEKNKQILNMEEIMIVYFESQDQEINHVAIRCLPTDTFAEVEEKIYKKFDNYRNTNNTPICATILIFSPPSEIPENKLIKRIKNIIPKEYLLL